MKTYSSPYEIIRGSSFLSVAVAEFERLENIRHFASSPYHPQTNGMVERMHSMLGHPLTTLTDSYPNRWDEYLAQSIFALSVRTHSVTKHSIFFLLYGDSSPPRQCMLPLSELELQDLRQSITLRELDSLGQSRAAAYLLLSTKRLK
jgi:transposase InsO family protein